jgi:ATP-dependent helicase HrpB
VLVDVVRARKPPWYDANDRVAELRRRAALLAEHVPEANLPTWDETTFDRMLRTACDGLVRVAEFDELDLAATLISSLPHDERTLIERETPEAVTLPGGRRVPVHYPPDRAPFIESRLQDFFGMTRAPALCKGRLPLTLHLLAPNQRAVQVTTDLDGFWGRHYPGIRRELCRRYPRHSWPEDGRTAAPPAPKNKR